MRIRTLLAGLLLWAGAAAAQTGGPYDLSWNTIDGGGDRSTGGTYAMSGTIGQADAGRLAGGSLILGGGFWKGGVSLLPAGIEEEESADGADDPSLPQAPSSFRLYANRPNPFGSSTALSFDLPAPAAVRMSVYGIRGELVRELIHDSMPAGHHVWTWDGSDDGGRKVSSGVYFLRIDAGEYGAQRKLWLIR